VKNLRKRTRSTALPVYEFQCPQGHVFEELVPQGTELIECPVCFQAHNPMKRYLPPMYPATRIMSATRTSFKFADQKLKK
jgi:hypothetical protein